MKNALRMQLVAVLAFASIASAAVPGSENVGPLRQVAVRTNKSVGPNGSSFRAVRTNESVGPSGSSFRAVRTNKTVGPMWANAIRSNKAVGPLYASAIRTNKDVGPVWARAIRTNKAVGPVAAALRTTEAQPQHAASSGLDLNAGF
jgi:hypothetical protein